jgi:hypothetical protein
MSFTDLLFYIKCEVLMALSTKVADFWDVIPVVDTYQCFGGTAASIVRVEE